MSQHGWLLPLIVVIVTVKVKIIMRRRWAGASPATGWLLSGPRAAYCCNPCVAFVRATRIPQQAERRLPSDSEMAA